MKKRMLIVLCLFFVLFAGAPKPGEPEPPPGCVASEDISWENGDVLSWGGYRENICGVAVQVNSPEWYSWFPKSQGAIGFTSDGWSMTFEIWDGHFNVVVTGSSLSRGVLYTGNTPLFTVTPTPPPTATLTLWPPTPTITPTPTINPTVSPSPTQWKHRLMIPFVRRISFIVGPPPVP